MIQQVKNLNLIFWGILIVIFDLTISSTLNGIGFKFDFINDLVGSVMIFMGLYKISKIELLKTSFNSKMNYCLIASGFHIVYSISNFFIYPVSDYVDTLKNVINLFIDWGLVSFAGAMIILTRETALKTSLNRWIIAKKLFFWIYFLPFVILNLITEILFYTKKYHFSWSSELGLKESVGSILIIALLLVPIIYGLFTIHIMKKEITEKN